MIGLLQSLAQINCHTRAVTAWTDQFPLKTTRDVIVIVIAASL